MTSARPVSRRGRTLASLLLLSIATATLSSFDWYTVSIAPNGKQTELGTLSGSSVYPLIQATSVLAVVATLVAAISAGLAQRVIIASISACAALSATAAAIGLSHRDLSAQQRQLDTWTSIASAHDIDVLTISSNANGWLFVAFSVGLVAVALLAVFSAKSWPVKVRGGAKIANPNAVEPEEPIDAIGLWESQRKAD